MAVGATGTNGARVPSALARPDPACPAPAPRRQVFLRAMGGEQNMYLLRDDMPLMSGCEVPQILLGDLTRQMQIWLSNCLPRPRTCHTCKTARRAHLPRLFSSQDPFQPSTRGLSLPGTVADFDRLANQSGRPDHERHSADCTIEGSDELTSHRRAIIACHSQSCPNCAIALGLLHSPTPLTVPLLPARFGPRSVSGLYFEIQRLL